MMSEDLLTISGSPRRYRIGELEEGESPQAGRNKEGAFMLFKGKWDSLVNQRSMNYASGRWNTLGYDNNWHCCCQLWLHSHKDETVVSRHLIMGDHEQTSTDGFF